MIIAGLIIYGIIYYGPGIWERIEETTADVGATPLRLITQNPETYENQEVVVIGMIFGVHPIIGPFPEEGMISGRGMIRDDEGFFMWLSDLPRGFIGPVDPAIRYKVTGKVIYSVTVNKWVIAVSNIRKI
jgi:hypothetical protein